VVQLARAELAGSLRDEAALFVRFAYFADWICPGSDTSTKRKFGKEICRVAGLVAKRRRFTVTIGSRTSVPGLKTVSSHSFEGSRHFRSIVGRVLQKQGGICLDNFPQFAQKYPGNGIRLARNLRKTQKKNSQGLYLEMRNKRWKWMAGATAATAAGVTASQASTITINLVNNYISAAGGNHLNADLTGDGQPDVTIANAFNAVVPDGIYYHNSYANVDLNGVHAQASFFGNSVFGFVQLGSRTGFSHGGGVYLTGSIPIFFKDLHINGGARTRGFLEVTVSSQRLPFFAAEVQLDSFTYNTPDQGSSLALLAMGAGGILALRRWKDAQERS